MTELSEAVQASFATRADCLEVVESLPLEHKVNLLTGASMWSLQASDHVGLRPVVFSDGPVGVRGTGEVPGETSVLFPTPSAVAATWDRELAFEVGQAFAREARDHGVDVVLAPQVNIQRTPVSGRHFECYSEDPFLTSAIGVTVVKGIQDQGVGACIKHYVANDSETDRTTYVSRVGMQALREVYLAPFADAVGAGTWSVMAAYNGVDDGIESATMTAHRHLVVDVLKDEFGFDGVVVSDWEATRLGVESALGGLDVVMPGPGGPWAAQLLQAVRDGRVPEREIDDKVARILLLAHRVGALNAEPRPITHAADLRALVRRAAASSTVVLRAPLGDAPWDRPAPASVALLGANAQRLHVLGGGSSTVHPEHVVSPAEGIAARWPDAELFIERGGNPRNFAPALDVPDRTDGVTVRHLGADGSELLVERHEQWQGWLRAAHADAVEVELTAAVRLSEPGDHMLSIGTVGQHHVTINDVIASTGERSVGVDCVLDSSVNNPAGVPVMVSVDGPTTVQIVARHQVIDAEGYGRFVRADLRHALPGRTSDQEIADAVEAAKSAHLVVVIVGTNEEVESEGWDRTTLALPGRQDELVERVLEVAPDAVIVVNAGAPVLLPWLERARTVLWAWFPGQEAGHALADVLAGVTEPAGRLPWTLPATEADVPVPHAVPAAGIVDYSEGVHVGYRGWQRSGATPAAPFGYGLGWTQWRYESIGQPRVRPDGDVDLDVTVANIGPRAGREVVQVYVEAPAGDYDRPMRWLGGFAAAKAGVGESATLTVRLPRRTFEVWDVSAHQWVLPTGEYRLRLGRSVRDIQGSAALTLGTPKSARRDG